MRQSSNKPALEDIFFKNPLIRNSSVKSHLAIINVRRLKWWSLALGPKQKKKKDILNNARNC